MLNVLVMDKYKLYQINIKILSLWTLEEDLFIYYCICTLCAWVHGCVGVFTKDSESQTMVLCVLLFYSLPTPLKQSLSLNLGPTLSQLRCKSSNSSVSEGH